MEQELCTLDFQEVSRIIDLIHDAFDKDDAIELNHALAAIKLLAKFWEKEHSLNIDSEIESKELTQYELEDRHTVN